MSKSKKPNFNFKKFLETGKTEFTYKKNIKSEESRSVIRKRNKKRD